MKHVILLLIVCGFFTGCTGLNEIGRVGDTVFHEVYSNGFWSKSHSMIVVHNTKTGEVQPASIGVGNGIISDIIGAGSNIGAAYLWGHSLKPDEYNSTNTDNSSINVDGGDNSSNSNAQQKQASTNKNRSNSSSHSDADVQQTQGQSLHNTNSNTNTNTNSNNTSTDGSGESGESGGSSGNHSGGGDGTNPGGHGNSEGTDNPSDD